VTSNSSDRSCGAVEDGLFPPGGETSVKASNFFAYSIPELRRLTGAQLLKIWGACAPYSRNWLYLHCILVLACCSLIFNLALRWSDSLILILFALGVALTVPANIYFFLLFKDRRQELRQYIEQNWSEFRP
jgi:hypothetical protein